jgi:hypothetical protein
VFKVCSSCGQEFQSWATECSDCHVPLDLAPGETLAAGETLGPEPAARPAAPLEDLVLVRFGEPWELRALAESLQARGISSQIDTYPPGASISGSRAGSRGQPARLGLYVPRADLDAVRELAGGSAASEVPDGGDAELAHDPNGCPACGEPMPENASACSVCGLEFPEVEPDPSVQ